MLRKTSMCKCSCNKNIRLSFSSIFLLFFVALCPSLSKSQRFLKWASNQLPPTWSSQLATLSGGLPELWRDGSLLCALINSAIPGACPNPHRHWRKPPSHGQTIAFKYLAVQPVFTDSDFEEKTLTIPQEQKFISYLLTLQQAMIKLNNKTEIHPQTCSSHYIARGMGLVTGTQNKDTAFYIYSTSKSSLTKDVIVKIRGPYSSYATVTIPAFRSSSLKQSSNNKLIFENKQRRSFLKSISMDFMSSEKGDDVIPVKIEMESDRAVVGFVPKHTGMYQIVLTSNNEHLAGSPYNLRILSDDSDDNDLKSSGRNKTTDDFAMRYGNREKKIVIPDTGYRFKISERWEKYDLKMAETKQMFEAPKNTTISNDKQNTLRDSELPVINKTKENENMAEKKRVSNEDIKTLPEANQIKDHFKPSFVNKTKDDDTSCNIATTNDFKPNMEETKDEVKAKYKISGIQFADKNKQTEEGAVSFFANKTPEIVSPNESKAETKPNFRQIVKQDAEKSPEKIASSICEQHIVPEEKSGEIQLSTFSLKENLVEEENETKIDLLEWNEAVKPPKTIKTFIKEKKDYWDHLILTNMKNADLDLKTKDTRLIFASKSLESLNKKFDFDFSLDKSVEDAEIPSVKERKSVLIEQLTDEQKLLQMQNEKKLKNWENKHKPKRCESFNSVFVNGECAKFLVTYLLIFILKALL